MTENIKAVEGIFSKDKQFVSRVRFAAAATLKGRTIPLELTALCVCEHNGGTVMVGCDGMRLHVAKIDDYEIVHGLYSVVKSTLNEVLLLKNNELGLIYPNWKELVNDLPVTPLPMRGLDLGECFGIGHLLCQLGKLGFDGFDHNFFSDLGKCRLGVCNICSKTSTAPLVLSFADGEYTALSMPEIIPIHKPRPPRRPNPGGGRQYA